MSGKPGKPGLWVLRNRHQRRGAVPKGTDINGQLGRGLLKLEALSRAGELGPPVVRWQELAPEVTAWPRVQMELREAVRRLAGLRKQLEAEASAPAAEVA